VDQLHHAGILGPPDGSRPREVLSGLDELAAILESSRRTGS
jgi:DNA segregation ATPase FtsK/SpoIIIE-like protein